MHRLSGRQRVSGRGCCLHGEDVEDFVSEPTTMPWGNRSLLFRDPDGNLVNFFTPVTPAAIEKFAR
jgi:Glyoxalase/Bleomycin resistance protein/Dioxygenase superfamily